MAQEAREKQIITPESRIKSSFTIKLKPNIVCPICKKEGRYLGSMLKHHFENCKEK
jgi:hypothetical protein